MFSRAQVAIDDGPLAQPVSGQRRRGDPLTNTIYAANLADNTVSVAVSGSTAVVGAADGNAGTGAAYVFTPAGTAWSQQAELTASDGAAGDLFGNSVAVSGSTAVVGAPGEDSFTGAAYVFTNV